MGEGKEAESGKEGEGEREKGKEGEGEGGREGERARERRENRKHNWRGGVRALQITLGRERGSGRERDRAGVGRDRETVTERKQLGARRKRPLTRQASGGALAGTCASSVCQCVHGWGF